MTLVQVDKRTQFSLTDMQTKRFSRLQSDYQWIFSHKKELRTKYPDKFIAVQNATVRYTADTAEQLVQVLSATNEQVEDFAVEYLSQKPTNLLF